MQRGQIQNKARAEQIRDFSGLRYGNITPTDLDMCIEYKNLCHVLAETKVKGTQLPFGQNLALTRIADDLQQTKPSLLIISSHETPVDQPIDMANTIVEKYYFKHNWHHPKKTITVREVTDKFIEKFANRCAQ